MENYLESVQPNNNGSTLDLEPLDSSHPEQNASKYLAASFIKEMALLEYEYSEEEITIDEIFSDYKRYNF